MRATCLFLVLFLLQGCASRLVITDRQNQLLSTMSESSAAEIAKKIFTRTNEQSGLLGSNGSPFITNPIILKIENGIITYTDYEEHLSGVEMNPTGSIVASWKHTVEKFTFDFHKIRKVRIVSRGVIREDLIKSVDGTQFALLAKDGIFVNIDVKKEYTDEVIALAKFYNPDVVIMSGIGL